MAARGDVVHWGHAVISRASNVGEDSRPRQLAVTGSSTEDTFGVSAIEEAAGYPRRAERRPVDGTDVVTKGVTSTRTEGATRDGTTTVNAASP